MKEEMGAPLTDLGVEVLSFFSEHDSRFPQIEKYGFRPFEKGDYAYAACLHELHDRVIIDIRRYEIIGTWNARQTRYFFLGELTATGSDGGEYRIPIREAYHNLNDLLNSLANTVARVILQHICVSVKQHPAFAKIGTFRLCFEFDPVRGESPIREVDHA